MARATWHVAPRDKRHRCSGALAHLLVFVASRSDRPFRSYSQKSLDTHPDRQTGPAELQKSTLPRRNLHSSEWTTSILLHYDFELEAICFEPLVSRSLCFVFHLFRLVMFIEAGDVTHRRRGQNRNEGLSKNFQVFYTENFFDPKLFILA